MANVNVTYDEMREAAKHLKSGQQDIADKLNALQKLVNSLVNGGYVTDSSSKHFEESYARFNSGATNVIGSLTDMGEYLTRAAQTFQDADEHLKNSLKH
jgi:WXG100 family type VII secretion target